MKRTELLLVANTPSANTQTLVDAVLRGARHPDIDNVVTRYLPPLAAAAADIMHADAVIIGTTENFGYMSGQIKDFFERIYYPCLEKTEAMPWALYVRGGKDGTGADRAVHSIVAGLRWREVQAPLIMRGDYQEEFVAACEELGMTIAAGLSAGLY